MNVRDELGRLTMFYLVESRVGPTDRPGFKYELTNDETFESEFIVASKLDCQRRALEQQSQNNLVEQDFIAIADARSARDNTLLLQYYSTKTTHANSRVTAFFHGSHRNMTPGSTFELIIADATRLMPP